MKILTVDKIKEADAYTIKNEPIESIDLMERAGVRCYRWIREKLRSDQKVKVVTGVGNNGGDGLVIARHFTKEGVDVEIWMLQFSDKYSDDFTENLNRLKAQGKATITRITQKDEMPVPGQDDVVIDAIFGSGLGRPVKGLPGEAINKINESEAVVVSIDIPSGMYADHYTDENQGAVIHADYTLTLQLPKLGMMLASTERFTGEMIVIPIGLHPDFLRQVDTDYQVITGNISEFLQPRRKFAHKGDMGHVLIIAGSYGKMGACVLASKACLRSGAGLVTARIPGKGYDIIQTAVPECMTDIDQNPEVQSELPDMNVFDLYAIGPGIGTSEKTRQMFKLLIQQSGQPLLLDADALNILSKNPTWFSFLPANSVLTTHHGEFDRLAGKSENSFQRLEKACEFARKHNLVIVLKGAYTAVCSPRGRVWFNSSGNPGMATAGSGDTLTGIIAAFMARYPSPFEATAMAVYMHGLAGDFAVKEKGEVPMIASDITEHLNDAWFCMNEGSPGERFDRSIEG